MRDNENFYKDIALQKKDMCLTGLDLSLAIGMEANRLADKYKKDSFECEDLQQILNIGRGNARELMNSSKFPTLTIGSRKIVSALGLATWMVQEYYAQK